MYLYIYNVHKKPKSPPNMYYLYIYIRNIAINVHKFINPNIIQP